MAHASVGEWACHGSCDMQTGEAWRTAAVRYPALFHRRREADDDGNMEDWDQEQLEKVIADKHAKEKTNATSIICRNFLDAVERKQYGW